MEGQTNIFPETGGGELIKNLKQTLIAGQTTLTFNSSAIRSNSLLSVFVDKFGVNPTAMTSTEGTATLTFSAQAENIEVVLQVGGVA